MAELSLFPGCSFLRPPNWRWQLIDAYSRRPGRRPKRLTHDPYFAKGLACLRQRHNQTPKADRGLAIVGQAIDFYRGSTEWDRCLIEARVLAREPIQSIAQRLSLSVSMLRAYCALFFDVADRLENASYILHHAVRLYEPIGADLNLPAIVKLLAYRGGPHVLDHVLAAFASEIDSRLVSDPAMTMDLDASSVRLARRAVHAIGLPITEHNAMRWLSLVGPRTGPPPGVAVLPACIEPSKGLFESTSTDSTIQTARFERRPKATHSSRAMSSPQKRSSRRQVAKPRQSGEAPRSHRLHGSALDIETL